MIHIITAENRRLFRHALMEMHRQRKCVFVDQLRWQLEAPEGLEIDAFDAMDTTYLVETSGALAGVRGSVRLLPSERPHLLSEVFGDLCEGALPRGKAIWEASRFCPAPDLPKGAPRQALLALMIAGIMETAILFGVEQVTYVASAALAPLALEVGWDARALGPRRRMGRDRVGAFIADIDAEGLRRVRARHGLSAPLTRFTPGALPLAA